ncbi:MAG: hydrogenase iron-sulfur subunit, partial [Candidatus Freyarchaeota archaeon]
KIIENPKSKNLIVRAEDTLMGRPVEVEADLVVLSVGLSPPKDQEKLLSKIGVPLSSDGFVLERHPKLRPVETQISGIYVAGCAQSPKDIQDSVSQAGAVAAKVAALLSKGEVEIEPYVPVLDPEECFKCGICATTCDRGAISINKEGVSISAAGCEGCGACAAACPSGALQIPISTDAQILGQIDTALKDKKEYPLIVAFLCNYCAYEAADTAGLNKIRYPTNVRPIWVMCSGRVNPQFVLESFEKGADGVLIMGCYPQDCHFRTGFLKTQRRVEVLREMLKSIGINPRRLRLESASASEGKKFAMVVKEFTEELRSLPTIGAELPEKVM